MAASRSCQESGPLKATRAIECFISNIPTDIGERAGFRKILKPEQRCHHFAVGTNLDGRYLSCFQVRDYGYLNLISPISG